MGRGKGHKRKGNPFAQKKREKREQARNGTGESQRPEAYDEIVRENESFNTYYKHQKICPEEEWDQFLNTLKSNLPTTFRVTGNKGESQAVLDIIKNEFFSNFLKNASELDSADAIEEPVCLPWYPKNLAWQLQLTRKDIRRSEGLYRLHNFLIAETNAGSISRQEAVSMIPPIVLDVKPNHKVFDMCAAPGSKTAQLIEALHAGTEEKIPPGFVIANDVDNNRCYMLVHQAKRLNSPCILVTNHDSSLYPNLNITGEDGKKTALKFDRILCDVPCSGDGTMRKNPDIWLKWNMLQGSNLNGLQYRIAKRGAELLDVGGRLVYSTCSLNPIENEAVICRLLKDSEGSLELIDASELVPGLKYSPGVTYWEPGTKDMTFYKEFSEVPEKYLTIIRPQMFPPTAEEATQLNLNRCMRILPHYQNTGAFFVAVLNKKKLLPWETIKVDKEVPNTENEELEINKEEKVELTEQKSAPWGPQRKKRRLGGYKEDPFVFFKDDEEVFQAIQEYYDLSSDFNPKCLLTRCLVGKKKNIYLCSDKIRDIVILNESIIKLINTGVKTFVRCDNKHMKCAFRLAQEGLVSINGFVGDTRRIDLQKEDLIILLENTNPIKSPRVEELSEATQTRTQDFPVGSCILTYSNEKFTLTLVGWKGTHSLRAYIDQNETVHMLRLLGGDFSKYEKNKFQKTLEREDFKKIEDDNLEGDDIKEKNVGNEKETSIPTE